LSKPIQIQNKIHHRIN